MGPELTPSPGKGHSAQAGFSLIELLVVIAVLAVLSVGAVLSAGRGGPEAAARSDMVRFQGSFATQQALAVQGRESLGLLVQGEGLRRARLGSGSWVLADGVQPWRGRVVFSAPAGALQPGTPDIRFLSNGRTSVFSIGFASGGRCESDGWTGLTCTES